MRGRGYKDAEVGAAGKRSRGGSERRYEDVERGGWRDGRKASLRFDRA